jgi:GDP-4-dehydro-6-deoxy-D-mannose reductase
VIRIRAFNHTGAGQDPRFVAPDFASQIARIEAGAPPLMRVGNMESVRDFLHVDDVLDAYIKLLEPNVASDVYNVASGIATQIGQLLRILSDLAGVEPEIQRDDDRWRPADSRVGDARKLREATGWSPLYSLPEILSELLDHWRVRIKEGPI